MILLAYFIKANIVFAVLLLVYFLFLRKEKFLVANRIILWTIVFASFILPLMPAIYHQNFIESTAQAVPDKLLSVPFNFSEIKATNPVAGQKYTGITVTSSTGWLTGLYAVVILLLLVRFLTRLLRVCSILKTSKQHKINGIIYCEPAIDTAPFSFFNFIVASRQIEQEKYRQIIAHERAHCLQGHSFDLLFADLMAMLLWINPLVYIYRHEVGLNLEYLADEATLVQGIDPKSYQLTLLAYSGACSFNFPVTPFSSRLRSRISMMNTSKPGIRNSYKYLALLPVLFLMSVLTGFKAARSGSVHIVVNNPVAEKHASIVVPLEEKTAKRPAVQPVQNKKNKLLTTDEEILKAIYINATTDTVKFKFTNGPADIKAKPFDGIYVIGDKIIPATDIRKAMQPTGELTFILPSRPAIAFYSANDPDAIEKWGAQAKYGVILLQPRSLETGRIIEASVY